MKEVEKGKTHLLWLRKHLGKGKKQGTVQTLKGSLEVREREESSSAGKASPQRAAKLAFPLTPCRSLYAHVSQGRGAVLLTQQKVIPPQLHTPSPSPLPYSALSSPAALTLCFPPAFLICARLFRPIRMEKTRGRHALFFIALAPL